MGSDSSSVQPPNLRHCPSELRRSRRRERTHNAATIAVVTTHAANPAAAMVHIPCMSYPPFGKRTTVAVTPAAMSPRIAQPTTATPQRSRRSMRWILVGHRPGCRSRGPATSVISVTQRHPRSTSLFGPRPCGPNTAGRSERTSRGLSRGPSQTSKQVLGTPNTIAQGVVRHLR